MTSEAGVVTPERVELAADAALLTSAAFALVTALTALVAPEGEVQGTASLLTAAGSWLSLALMAAGPLLAWRLHGRPLTWGAVLGGLTGGFLAAAAAMVVALVAMVLGRLTSLLANNEDIGPYAVLAVLGVICVVVIARLVFAAVRDLAPSRREDFRLQVIRLVCAAIVAVAAAGVAIWTVRHPGGTQGQALILGMATGLAGAGAVAGAEFWTQRYGSSRPLSRRNDR